MIGGYSYHFRQHNISRVYCSRVDPVPPAPPCRGPPPPYPAPGGGVVPTHDCGGAAGLGYLGWYNIIGACPERYLRIYLHTNIPWRSRVYGYRVFNKPTVSRPPADTYIPRAGCPDYTYHPKYPNPVQNEYPVLWCWSVRRPLRAWTGADLARGRDLHDMLAPGPPTRAAPSAGGDLLRCEKSEHDLFARKRL